MAEPVLLINLAGNVEMVDPAEAGSLVAAGYVPASPEQARDWALEQKYGTQPVRAGLESFGSMLTFGLSDVLARQMGVPAEDLAGREKANPMASMLGSAAGVVAPAIVTAGLSAEAQGAAGAARVGAELAAPSLIARAGRAAAKGAEKLLPEAETLIGRLARKGAAGAAGGAVEGALFEVGHLVHEAALEDPGLTAESALAQVGLSAALMGGLAGSGSVLGALTKQIAPKMDMGKKVASWLESVEGRGQFKQAGGVQSDLRRFVKKMGSVEAVEKAGREMGELGLVDVFSTPSATLERADALLRRSGAEMGEILRSADAIAAAEKGRLADLGKVVARLRTSTLQELEAAPLQRGAASRFRKDLDDFARLGERGTTLEELHQIRRQVDDGLYGWRGNMDPDANAYRSALHNFRRGISREIEAGLEKSGIPLDLWKTANRENQLAHMAQELAEAGLERAVGNNKVGLSALLSGVAGTVSGGPLGGIAGAAGAELARRHGAGTMAWLAKGLRNVIGGEAGQAVVNRTARQIAQERAAGAATGVAIAQARGVAAPETRAALAVLEEAKRQVSREMDDGIRGLMREAPAAARRTVVTAATHARHLEEMGRLVSDVGSLSNALAAQALDTSEHAPNVAQAMQLSSARAAAFLAQKTPPRPAQTLLGPKWRPTRAEQSSLERTFSVVDKPLTVLRLAREGTLTPAHVEALKAAWPSLYSHLQSRILQALVDRGDGGQLPYRSRMMLSMLMGQDIDGTMLGRAILANQAVFAQSHAPAAPPGPENTDKLTLGARSATQGQAADVRRAEAK